MNLSTHVALAGLWLLWCAPALSAQIGFSLPDVTNAPPGSNLLLPVEVQNFTGIAGVQFALRWDPEVLEYDAINSYGIPGLDTVHFNFSQAQDSGIIRFVYAAPSLTQGVSLADGAALFTMKFHVVGPINSGTDVLFTEFPPVTYFEVVTIQGQAFDFDEVEIEQGSVCVSCSVGAAAPEAPALEAEVLPNPAADHASIRFALPAAASVSLRVADATGRVLASEAATTLSAGRHALDLPLERLASPGLYFVTLRADNRQAVRAILIHP